MSRIGYNITLDSEREERNDVNTNEIVNKNKITKKFIVSFQKIHWKCFVYTNCRREPNRVVLGVIAAASSWSSASESRIKQSVIKRVDGRRERVDG